MKEEPRRKDATKIESYNMEVRKGTRKKPFLYKLYLRLHYLV